jgi:uncharacterized membrane protein YeaQ/YmgE (transglycosylase-associated protein family)
MTPFLCAREGERLSPDLGREESRAHRRDGINLISHAFGRSETKMHMSNESLLVVLLVGLIAGWLAGQIVQGTGFGIVGDLIVGIVGAFLGSSLLPRLGIHLGSGLVAAIVNATIGAVILLLIIRLVRGAAGPRTWGGGWRRRW